MPTPVNDVPHYVPGEKIPQIAIQSTISTAFRLLGKWWGFVMTDSGIPMYYATRGFLQFAASHLGLESGMPAVAVLPLHDLLGRYLSPMNPLASAARVELARSDHPIRIEATILQLDGQVTFSFDSPPQVLAVYNWKGDQVGWYLNHESLGEPANATNTPAPEWVCKNQPPHKNNSFDSGYCQYCPEELLAGRV